MVAAHGYRQTEAGHIPANWSVRPLFDAVQIANGQVDPRLPPYKSMVLVAPDHVECDTGRLIEKRTAEEQGAISGKYLFAPGDIVYSKIRPYLHKAILADFAGLCSADMYPLTPREGVASGYVLAMLLGRRFSDFAESVSVRSGIPKINREEMAEFVMPLPPPEEQRAIATALSDVDALLLKLDQLIAKKRDVKQGGMQNLLRGQKRLPGFKGDWSKTPFSEIARPRAGRIDPKKTGGHPRCVELEHIGQGTGVLLGHGFAGPEASLKSIFRAGDVLFGKLRAYLRKFWLADCDGVCSTEIWALVPATGIVDSKFLFQIVQVDEFIDAASTAYGTHMPRSDWAVVKNYEVALPPLDEQVAIASALWDMDAEIAALEARRDKTRLLKQGMMQELLTGRIRLV